MNMATVLQEFDGRQRPFCTEPGKENIFKKYANHEGYEKVVWLWIPLKFSAVTPVTRYIVQTR